MTAERRAGWPGVRMTAADVRHGGRPPYRADIDGLRALAVLLVVVFHGFPDLVKGGFIGVDVFFVISGFLISQIIIEGLRQGEFSFLRFYNRRIRRIFPALALVLGVSLVAGWFVLLPEEYEQLGRHVAAGAMFLQNYALASEAGYFDTASELKPLMHIWSLAIEEQFYLVFPAFLFAASRVGRRLFWPLVGLCVLSFAINIDTVRTDRVAAFFMPYTRFWELTAGAVLAACMQAPRTQASSRNPLAYRSSKLLGQLSSSGGRNLASITGLSLIILGALTIHHGKVFPGYWAIAPVLGTLLVIAAGPSAWANRRILSIRCVVYLGLISYPLYLWHWPLLSFLRIVNSGSLPTWLVLAAIVISLALSWLTYEVIEKAVRYPATKAPHTAVLCTAIVLVALAGMATEHQKGWEDRPQVRILQEQMKQFQFARTRDPKCDSEYPEYKSAYCFKSGADAPDVVLIGDSHSNMLYYGLATVLGKSNLVVANFGQNACVPFLNVSTRQRGTIDRCAEVMNRAIYSAAADEHVRAVILSSRGPLYISGKGYGDTAAETALDFQLNLIGASDSADAPTVFETGLRNTLRVLNEAGKKVILVLDVPELGFDPKSCVTRPLRNWTNQECRIPYAAFLSRNETYHTIVRRVAKEFARTEIFDASRVYCDGSWCRAIVDGKMLYRDGDHPSLSGSHLIATHLVRLIQSSDGGQ